MCIRDRSTTTATATTVSNVMGPPPPCVEGESATVGDVAVICAAAAHGEPVAIVDGEGRLRRVLRQEDLLKPVRSFDADGDGDGGEEGGGGGRNGGDSTDFRSVTSRRDTDPR